MNNMEDTMTVAGLKLENKNKIWSEVKGRKLLDEEIKDDRSVRKTNRGQLSKKKKPSLDALEHRVRWKER
jgi:hypothetical protein